MQAFGDSITHGEGASDWTTTGYPPLLAAALGLVVDNHAVSGVAMNTPPGTCILDQMLSVSPPTLTRYEICVMTCGTNDMNGYGTDATRLLEFQAGLQQGLLYLTSHRRVPEPRTDQERLLVRRGGRLPSVSDGCSVWVGNTPKQVPGNYIGVGSPAAQVLYAAAVAAAVAAVAAAGRRVYLVDVAAVYDPATMTSTPPSGLHPDDSGYLVIKNAFYAAIRG